MIHNLGIFLLQCTGHTYIIQIEWNNKNAYRCRTIMLLQNDTICNNKNYDNSLTTYIPWKLLSVTYLKQKNADYIYNFAFIETQHI